MTAHETLSTFCNLGLEFFKDRINIGYWHWELPKWPKDLVPLFSIIDELWVSSKYEYNAFINESPIPVKHMPYPVFLPRIDKYFEREYFNDDLTSIDSKIFSYEINYNYKFPINDKNKIELGYDGKYIDDLRQLDFNITDTSGELPLNTNFFRAINDYAFKRNIHGILYGASYPGWHRHKPLG